MPDDVNQDFKDADDIRNVIQVLQGILTRKARDTALGKVSPERRTALAGLARTRFETRRKRKEILGRSLWNESCWDIMLDIYLAGAGGIRLSVSDVGHASGIPSATLVRWLHLLADKGLIVRSNDAKDKRRTWVGLSMKGLQTVEDCLMVEGEANSNFSSFARPRDFMLGAR